MYLLHQHRSVSKTECFPNCIVGFCAEAEFGSEMKMIGDLSVVPGVKGIGGYSVTVEGESAYCNTK